MSIPNPAEESRPPQWRWSRDPDDPQQVYEHRPVLDDPLNAALNLDVRVVRALRVADVTTVGELVALSERDLGNVRDLTAKDVKAIVRAVVAAGVALAPDERSMSFTPGASEGHGQGEIGANQWTADVARELHEDLMWWPFAQVSVPYVRQRVIYVRDAADPKYEKRLAAALDDVLMSLDGEVVDTRSVALAVCGAVGDVVHRGQVVPCRPV